MFDLKVLCSQERFLELSVQIYAAVHTHSIQMEFVPAKWLHLNNYCCQGNSVCPRLCFQHRGQKMKSSECQSVCLLLFRNPPVCLLLLNTACVRHLYSCVCYLGKMFFSLEHKQKKSNSSWVTGQPLESGPERLRIDPEGRRHLRDTLQSHFVRVMFSARRHWLAVYNKLRSNIDKQIT